MHGLVTGGCGFIGSHLAERLLADGHGVTILDDLSTGAYRNVAHLEHHPALKLVIGSVLDENLVCETMHDCDVVFHLASAVGVKLIMDRPVHTITTIFRGTDVVLQFAARYRKRVLLASTSEVYGKSENVPFDEDGDRLEGPTSKHRWAYACAKALDEFLALAHWKESRLPVIVARLFNTVGPRQTGQYGMVVPNFVGRALANEPLVIHGDGQQSRCFAHVLDVVDALVSLAQTPAAYGQVINVGTDQEVTIRELAERVVQVTGSQSEIRHQPYETVYGEGFEDMRRRVPSLMKLQRLVGRVPQRSLNEIIRDVAQHLRGAT
uniref:NAD-dependent epimerase/dehydratase family protein n=1 Tax=Schlesneria paludicola TaxID=360056 RepID=A0A7C2K085_9PLAN